MTDKKVHNRDAHPEIWNAMQKAKKEEAKLLAKRKVHTDKMKPLRAEIIELQGKVNALNGLAMADAPRITEVRKSIATYARAMGAVEAGGK